MVINTQTSLKSLTPQFGVKFVLNLGQDGCGVLQHWHDKLRCIRSWIMCYWSDNYQRLELLSMHHTKHSNQPGSFWKEWNKNIPRKSLQKWANHSWCHGPIQRNPDIHQLASICQLQIFGTVHTVRNLHFLSKNSTLISRDNCRFFWEKNSWKCCGFGLFSCWQLWFHEKNCQKNFVWKNRENVGVFLTKIWLFE